MAAARQSRASWNKLLDDSDQPCWVVDAQWRIVLANTALQTWWGDGGNQLAGQEIPFSSALAPDPTVFTGRAEHSIVVHPFAATEQLAVHWLPIFDKQGKVQAAWAWGTRASSDEQGSPANGSELQSSPARISAATNWSELLAEHRARARMKENLGRFVGDSLAMQTLRARAELAARQAGSIWIFGPVGSGRRTLARAIHEFGTEPDVPFAEWDAALLTPELLQRQLQDLSASLKLNPLKNPSPRQADVLLLNADSLAASSQRELLEFQTRAQVRLLLTSHYSPEKLVQQNLWPAELAARWSALALEIPALAARLADLPLLVQHLVQELNRAGNKQHRGCSLAALELMAAYRWPGDVAELSKVLRTAHHTAASVEIQPADLPSWLRQAESALSSPRPVPQGIDLDQQLAEIERELLGRALRLADGNKTQAAKLVGWTRQRLLRRAEELGIISSAATKNAKEEPEYIADLPFEPEE